MRPPASKATEPGLGSRSDSRSRPSYTPATGTAVPNDHLPLPPDIRGPGPGGHPCPPSASVQAHVPRQEVTAPPVPGSRSSSERLHNRSSSSGGSSSTSSSSSGGTGRSRSPGYFNHERDGGSGALLGYRSPSSQPDARRWMENRRMSRSPPPSRRPAGASHSPPPGQHPHHHHHHHHPQQQQQQQPYAPNPPRRRADSRSRSRSPPYRREQFHGASPAAGGAAAYPPGRTSGSLNGPLGAGGPPPLPTWLVQCRLAPNVRGLFESLYLRKLRYSQELDGPSCVGFLEPLTTQGAMQVIDELASLDLFRIRNITAFFIGICKRVASRQPPPPGRPLRSANSPPPPSMYRRTSGGAGLSNPGNNAANPNPYYPNSAPLGVENRNANAGNNNNNNNAGSNNAGSNNNNNNNNNNPGGMPAPTSRQSPPLAQYSPQQRYSPPGRYGRRVASRSPPPPPAHPRSSYRQGSLSPPPQSRTYNGSGGGGGYGGGGGGGGGGGMGLYPSYGNDGSGLAGMRYSRMSPRYNSPSPPPEGLHMGRRRPPQSEPLAIEVGRVGGTVVDERVPGQEERQRVATTHGAPAWPAQPAQQRGSGGGGGSSRIICAAAAAAAARGPAPTPPLMQQPPPPFARLSRGRSRGRSRSRQRQGGGGGAEAVAGRRTSPVRGSAGAATPSGGSPAPPLCPSPVGETVSPAKQHRSAATTIKPDPSLSQAANPPGPAITPSPTSNHAPQPPTAPVTLSGAKRHSQQGSPRGSGASSHQRQRTSMPPASLPTAAPAPLATTAAPASQPPTQVTLPPPPKLEGRSPDKQQAPCVPRPADVGSQPRTAPSTFAESRRAALAALLAGGQTSAPTPVVPTGARHPPSTDPRAHQTGPRVPGVAPGVSWAACAQPPQEVTHRPDPARGVAMAESARAEGPVSVDQVASIFAHPNLIDTRCFAVGQDGSSTVPAASNHPPEPGAPHLGGHPGTQSSQPSHASTPCSLFSPPRAQPQPASQPGSQPLPGAHVDAAGLESSALRQCLTDLVKEVMKPAWRANRLSREVFKSLAKTAVDKILCTLPNGGINGTYDTPAGAIQFLSDVRRNKIQELVQRWVAQA
ncbi:MAG: hypothetical protein WDW36_007592 [Sanguina aurantia]